MNSSSRFYCQSSQCGEVESDKESELQSFQERIEDEGTSLLVTIHILKNRKKTSK